MRRTICLLFSFVLIFALTACGQSAVSEKQEAAQSATQKTEEQHETSQNGAGIETEKQETKEQPDAEVETGPSESVSTEEQEADMSTKTLVAYFSCTGTTKPLAEYAAEIIGADLYEIVAEDPYTEADSAYYTNGRADQEQNDPDVRPAISRGVENMDTYDTIILGYPIWHGQAPRIISTFLESYDFSGKTIIPFCTSHSSGIGSSADNLHILCSDSTVWLEGRRFEAGTSKEAIEEWLGSEGIN